MCPIILKLKAMPDNKRILKEIAKRFCKSVLYNSEASVHFDDTGLTEEEVEFIQKEIEAIASRITKLETITSTDELVNQYFEFE